MDLEREMRLSLKYGFKSEPNMHACMYRYVCAVYSCVAKWIFAVLRLKMRYISSSGYGLAGQPGHINMHVLQYSPGGIAAGQDCMASLNSPQTGQHSRQVGEGVSVVY